MSEPTALRPDAVVVSFLAASETPIQFTTSWANMLQYDAARGRHLIDGGGSIAITSGPRIAEARSQLVDAFFSEPKLAAASWLLMIDSDMVFEPDLVERMLTVADRERVPILGGLCFAGGRDHDPYPTVYEEEAVEHEGKAFVGIRPIHDYPRDALVKVGATGAACLMVHRQVFVAMSHPYPKGFGTHADGTKSPYPWFVEGLVTPTGEPIGEDIAFCRRASQLGIPIHVHTGIRLGHVKNFVLDEEWYDGVRAARDDAEARLQADALARTAEAQATRKPADERRAAARKALADLPAADEDRSDEILAGALG